ncbi:MAG: sialate O-acetylesterase [Gemmatimonadota bacterium]|nr:sialate O-acetylesterase [Gemmatimonadota bacterium]
MSALRTLIVVALASVACARGPAAAPASPPREGMELFLLAGQSNMAGRGVVEDEDRIAVQGVDKLTRDLTWVPATDPVHFDKTIAGVGPGRAFGLAVHAREPSAHIGLVPTAMGGSPITSWEPGALDKRTSTHPYDEALVRARAAMRDGRFRAILWHQGESDANPAASVLYADRLRALIARFRRDLGDPDLPFLIGQLGRFDGAPWDAATIRVDSAQRAVAASTPHVAYVSAEGLRDMGDVTHFDAAGARELGRRYAAAYFALIDR